MANNTNIAQVKTVICKGQSYMINETDTKRDVDFRRFCVQKQGAKKPYIVSFQTKTGRKAACSCPAGCNQKHCKHVDLVINLLAA